MSDRTFSEVALQIATEEGEKVFKDIWNRFTAEERTQLINAIITKAELKLRKALSQDVQSNEDLVDAGLDGFKWAGLRRVKSALNKAALNVGWRLLTAIPGLAL